MLEWLQDKKVTINIDKVVIPMGCCPAPAPSPPTKRPTLLKGEAVVMIKFPVEVDPNTTNTDVEKTRIITTPTGQPSTTEDFLGNGGKFKTAAVEDGSSGEVQYAFVDRKGNISTSSPATPYTNASDETPPDGPTGAPRLGAGESV